MFVEGDLSVVWSLVKFYVSFGFDFECLLTIL